MCRKRSFATWRAAVWRTSVPPAATAVGGSGSVWKVLRGRAEAPFAFRPEDVHAQITMRSIPVSRAFRSSADDFLPSLLLAAEGGPAPVFPELLQEPGPRQRSLVAGHLGPERLHQRSGPGGRNAEELLDVAAREEGPVELFELADGVGDGEEPPGLGGHR